MPDLATLTDLEDRIGRNLTVNEQRIATRLLADASAAVRLYTGQQFTEVEDDVVTLKVRRGKVRLPQRPVTAISSVTATALDFSETPVGFRWDGIETLLLGPNVPDAFGWEPFRRDVDTVTVIYTHGYPVDELPAALTALVVQIVGRALGSELVNTGIVSENIAGYGYTLGSAAAAGGFGLLPAEKDALDVFRRVGGFVQVGP